MPLEKLRHDPLFFCLPEAKIAFNSRKRLIKVKVNSLGGPSGIKIVGMIGDYAKQVNG